MSLDHCKALGRSGLKVSPLCLGTMTFGEDAVSAPVLNFLRLIPPALASSTAG